MKPLIVPSVSIASGLTTYIVHMAGIQGLSATYVVQEGSEMHRRLPSHVDVIFTDGSTRDLTKVISRQAPLHSGVQTHGSRSLLAARMARINSRIIGHVIHEFPWGTGARGWIEMALTARTLRAANGPGTARLSGRLGLPCFSVLPPILKDTFAYPRTIAREKLGLPPTRTAVGVIGRLSPAKDPLLALRAFAALPPNLRDSCDLVFIGDGPLRKTVLEEGRKLHLQLRMLGQIPDAATFIKCLDVLVVPSRHETFGLSMAEALLAGVAVAATRSPGSQLLQSAGSQLDLARSEPRDLARVIEGTLASPQVDLDQRLLDAFGLDALSPTYLQYFREMERRASCTVSAKCIS